MTPKPHGRTAGVSSVFNAVAGASRICVTAAAVHSVGSRCSLQDPDQGEVGASRGRSGVRPAIYSKRYCSHASS